MTCQGKIAPGGYVRFNARRRKTAVVITLAANFELLAIVFAVSVRYREQTASFPVLWAVSRRRGEH